MAGIGNPLGNQWYRRPVTLTFYDVARIDDYYVRQASVTKDPGES